MFSRAGVDVTLVCRSRLLPEMEPEIGAALTDYLSSEGITVFGNLAYQSVHKTAEGGSALTVLRDGVAETIVAERLLVATGRAPNVEDLGLIEAGVKQTLSGAILVDDHMRTSRSEEHTSELQSLMRISYAVFCLNKTKNKT